MGYLKELHFICRKQRGINPKAPRLGVDQKEIYLFSQTCLPQAGFRRMALRLCVLAVILSTAKTQRRKDAKTQR